jgi:hypothetical protein
MSIKSSLRNTHRGEAKYYLEFVCAKGSCMKRKGLRNKTDGGRTWPHKTRRFGLLDSMSVPTTHKLNFGKHPILKLLILTGKLLHLNFI